MRVEGRWRVLCGSDMETFLNGCSLVSSTESIVVLVICGGLLELRPASMFSALLPPHSSDVFGSLESWALVLRVTVPVRLMMNLLFVRGLRGVSLSSCLFTYQHQSLSWTTVERKRAIPTIIALSNPVLYPSTLSQVRYLGPIFIWVGTGAEGTAGAMA